MNLFFVFFTFGMWAWSFPLGKWTASSGSILLATSLRQVLAACVMMLFLGLFRRKLKLPTKAQWGGVIILGVFGFYVTNYLELFGLREISSSRASLIYGLSPFIAAFLSYVKLKEKVTLKKCFGLLVGFSAFIPVFAGGNGESLLDISRGDLALVGATAFAMYGWVILRSLVKDKGMDPIGANAWAMLVGGLACLGHSLIQDSWSQVPIVNVKSFSFGILSLVILSNLICSNLYSFLLRKYTVTFLALAGLSSPFFASIWGFLFLGESFEYMNLLSALIMILGLWIVYQEEKRLTFLPSASHTSS